MKFECFVLCTCFYIVGVRSFIVIPEELPSILSVLYSNIPPVKKGTDSRIGIGFRLGPNADFQVQFEIGPQTNTQPIGPNATANNGKASKKRQTHSATPKRNLDGMNPSEKWLNTWKLNMNEDENQQLPQESQVRVSDPTKENFSFVSHLRQLYRLPNNSSNEEKET
ncbi:hypothetical protein PGB90_009245 [Kerria lacca]